MTNSSRLGEASVHLFYGQRKDYELWFMFMQHHTKPPQITIVLQLPRLSFDPQENSVFGLSSLFQIFTQMMCGLLNNIYMYYGLELFKVHR